MVGGALTTLACDEGVNDRTSTHCEPKWDYLWMGAMFQVSRIQGNVIIRTMEWDGRC